VQIKFISDVKDDKLDVVTIPAGVLDCETCPPATVCGEMISSAEYWRWLKFPKLEESTARY
jgi:hypothetical protein